MASLSRLLSDWEVEEAHGERLRGAQMDVLAFRYGISERALRRAFQRLERREDELHRAAAGR